MNNAMSTGRFAGKYFGGKGDVEYLQLLDIARRMFEPDPEFQNMPMLYTPAWNGLVDPKQLRHHLLRAAILPGAVCHLLAKLPRPLVRPDGRWQTRWLS